MTFCRSIYVKKVMKLLAFKFEQPSYSQDLHLTIIYFFDVTTLVFVLRSFPSKVSRCSNLIAMP